MIRLTLVQVIRDADIKTVDIDPNDITLIGHIPGRYTGTRIFVKNKVIPEGRPWDVTEDLLTVCTLIAQDRAGAPEPDQFYGVHRTAPEPRVTITPDGHILIH